MKSLTHNGLYFKSYQPIRLTIKYKDKEVALSSNAEEMAIAFTRKLDSPYIQDDVFLKNFLADFGEALNLSNLEFKDLDLTSVKTYVDSTKETLTVLSNEDKKKLRLANKEKNNKLKEKYGYALVDNVKTGIANWTAEPASIFLSKGKNPLRGHWKSAITNSDVIYNSSDATSLPQGAKTVWESKQFWVAKYSSPLDGKIKYVWLSASSKMRQNKDKKKFETASRLSENIKVLDSFIDKELCSKDKERRKLATATYIIKSLALRVGDEKTAGERGTVGCTTLKKEHLSFSGDNLHLSFKGKDYVQWDKDISLPSVVSKNIKEFMQEAGDSSIFEGIGSAGLTRFLREKIPSLTAKVFRTYLAGETWDTNAEDNLKLITFDTSDSIKKYLFKKTNLEVAKKLNHKRTPPKNYQEKLIEKEEKLKNAQRDYQLNTVPKKLIKLEHRVEKLAADLELYKETSEWNLGTSMASYIDPNKIFKFARKAELKDEDVYSKTLLEKYSWARAQT